MHRGMAMRDWRRGLLVYIQADDAAIEEFKKIVEICGGEFKPRNMPCLSSLAARLEVKSASYLTDIYGISNSIAFSKGISRAVVLEKAWAFLEELFCKTPIECDEEVSLSCCEKCGWACLLAKVASNEITVDLREEIYKKLASLPGG